MQYKTLTSQQKLLDTCEAQIEMLTKALEDLDDPRLKSYLHHHAGGFDANVLRQELQKNIMSFENIKKTNNEENSALYSDKMLKTIAEQQLVMNEFLQGSIISVHEMIDTKQNMTMIPGTLEEYSKKFTAYQKSIETIELGAKNLTTADILLNNIDSQEYMKIGPLLDSKTGRDTYDKFYKEGKITLLQHLEVCNANETIKLDAGASQTLKITRNLIETLKSEEKDYETIERNYAKLDDDAKKIVGEFAQNKYDLPDALKALFNPTKLQNKRNTVEFTIDFSNINELKPAELMRIVKDYQLSNDVVWSNNNKSITFLINEDTRRPLEESLKDLFKKFGYKITNGKVEKDNNNIGADYKESATEPKEPVVVGGAPDTQTMADRGDKQMSLISKALNFISALLSKITSIAKSEPEKTRPIVGKHTASIQGNNTDPKDVKR